MSVSRLSRGYASALIDLAAPAETEALAGEVRALSLLCDECRPFLLFLRSPVIPQHKKKAVILTLFEGTLHRLLLTFLLLLVRRRRELYLPQILSSYIDLHRARLGFVPATLTLAAPPDEALLRHFRAWVKKITQKEADLSVVVAPECIGGYKLEVGQRQIDHLVSSHLDRIKDHLGQS